MVSNGAPQPTDEVRRQNFVRWQQVMLGQMSQAISLFLAFAGASIGYEVNLSLDDRFSVSTVDKSLFLLSLILLGASVAFGLGAVVTRLNNARLTTRIARLNWQPPDLGSEIDLLRAKGDRLGRVSWSLLYIQIGLFGFGIMAGALVMFVFVASRPL